MKPKTRRLSTLASSLLLAATTLSSAQAAESRDALMKEHRGGVMKLNAHGSAGTIDPMINYELQFWQLLSMTNDGLLAFKKVDGAAGNTIVPDLAEELPKPEDGGKTYVFKLRPGLKFSTGKEITTADVVASFERIFKVSSPTAGSFYNGIVGAEACLKDGATCSLKDGVIGDEKAHTVTFHLTTPDAEFFDKLAVPHASILPADTSPKDLGTTPAAATGPYMIQSYDPDHGMKIVRNPNFKEFSVDAQPDGYIDEFDYNFGLDDQAGLTAVLNGQADWTFDDPPSDRLGELGTKYAKQVKVHTLSAYYYVPMNVNLPPFNNAKARQAVAYAVDRKALVGIFGGPNLAAPLCQHLPVGMAGYEPYCPFTKSPGTKWTAPDMEKAKQLIEESGTKGQKVTLIGDDKAIPKSIATYMQGVLRDLGYDASLKTVSHNIQFTYIQNTNNNVQISVTDWYADYPAPSDFLNVLYGCDSFHPASDSSINISGWCDKKVDGDMKQALATAVTDPKAADVMWAKIDKEITDAAPAAALFQPKRVDVISTRVGNFMFNDSFHMLFSQAWVK
ncbi:ABC transporter substrate-binding protein [Lichenifustis flavocetrariae]|uniref:ABC transporter substrate-binding protein n=1 Tax=Lichenifustis flavocetrariae TaxID=2949735 RepID=A0AA41YX40_9HYPH|nr:ABC transporter substrate-binding protein [Lichenifustis flavocetrariae]MCW6508608.1 ABC transporter substrate-binding protein [Lichenifustis flavocetrariae]